MMYWTTPEIGQKLVNVALSLDLRTKSAYDFETVLANYTDLKAVPRDADAIARDLEDLEKDLAPYGGLEGEYLKGIVTAFKCLNRVVAGDQLSYEEKMRDVMQIPIRPIPAEKTEGLRLAVETKLTDLGYKGTTMEKIAAWKADWQIPTEEVTTFARKYLDACKKATVERVVELPPEDEIDNVEGVRGVFWSGYSSYLGDHKGRLRFNLDRPWSGPLFINVLAHEGYPGHQVSYCRWDWLYRQGKYPVEAAYYMLANPANTVFEGLPENGTHFLGWDQPGSPATEIPEDLKAQLALAWDVSDLQRVIQQTACLMYNAQGASEADVMEYFRTSNIFSDVEARNTFRFFSHPIQHICYPSYYYGRWIVRQAWDACTEEQHKGLFKLLYDTPLSNNTFIKGVENLTGKPFTPFETI